MPIDRVDKTDPTLYRVEETRDQNQRRRGQEQSRENDKFEKKPSVWRRILGQSSGHAPSILAGKPLGFPVRAAPTEQAESEESFTFSERMMVAWGILGPDGKVRPVILLTYVLVLGMILGATLLIIGTWLWQ